MKYVIFLPVILVLHSCSSEAQVDEKKIMAHVKVLSDDSFEGRGTGTTGEQASSKYITKFFKQLKLQPKGDSGTFYQYFPFNKGIHGEGEAGMAANVVGYLDNNSSSTIIIGAHYDHLGTDGQHSSLDANPGNKIHNGADDNASGVAGVLELARYFSNNKVKENNNFLFLCFSGEELGLLGSKYFTEHPSLDLSSIDFMINMDMIGRLDQGRNLIINGTGTSPTWEPLLKKIESTEFAIKTDSSGVGPSDHTSFYLKGIPVLHFFTGGHSDYHKPTDDWNKINSAGEAGVLRLIIRIIESLDNEPKLAFLKTKTKSMADRSPFKVTLGIMPSYAGGSNGLKVDGVSDNRPADKAGILSGDVIVEMGTHTIRNIKDYMDALDQYDKGQTITVKVKRGEEVLSLNVTF